MRPLPKKDFRKGQPFAARIPSVDENKRHNENRLVNRLLHCHQMFQRIISHHHSAPIVAFFSQQKEEACFTLVDLVAIVAVGVRVGETHLAKIMIEMVGKDFATVEKRLPNVWMAIKQERRGRQPQLVEAQAQVDEIKL